MKRSGFRQQSPEEVKQKQALKRKKLQSVAKKPKTPLKSDGIFNDFECELKILQEFVSGFGYKLDVSRRTECGQFWKGSTENKYYDWTEDWLKALLKKRRKELERAKIKE